MGKTHDVAWAAGLFEGEGSFVLARGRYPKVSLAMTDEDVVRRFAAVVGVGRVYGPVTQAPGRRPLWDWQANHRDDVVYVIQLFAGYLGARRWARAVELLEAAKRVRSYRRRAA